MLILILIVICTFLLCFVISHIFLSVFLYESKEELKNFKNDIFSYIFGLSNILLILIVLEIADIDDFQIRNITWILFLWTFIGIMFYIIPYYILNMIICGTGNRGYLKYIRKFFVFLIFLIYLITANRFLFMFKDDGYLKNSNINFFLFYIKPVCMMEYLSIIGILASAILSGYGSTHCILNYLVYPCFKNSLETQHKRVKLRMSIISEEISLKENELYGLEAESCNDSDEGRNNSNISSQHRKVKLIIDDGNPDDLFEGLNDPPSVLNSETPTKSNNHPVSGTVKGFFNYLIGKDNKKDMNEEIDELKILYNEMEMQVKLIKEKTILFRDNFISSIKYFFHIITGKILAFYCIYRIIMTIKNLLFQNYSDINVMLKEELLNIIDVSLNIVFYLLKWDVETIYYTFIEQYFSLLIVGTIIIVNIRSFLNTILFIYTKTLKKYNTKVNKNVQLLFLSYFVGLFYVTSSIFLIFNLPITYR
jgi:hypothetical protein